MVFSSTTFLFFFFPLLVIAYYFPYLKKSIAYRNGILLMASLLFYTWGEPLFVFVLIISILTNWILGNSIGMYRKSSRGKVLLGVAVIYNLGLLVVFKYLNFITDNISKVFHNPGIVTQIALPIGISFFTFQILSYIFDIYYGKTCAQKSIWKLALYIMLFPQMVAGPIVRYEQIEQELDKRISSQKEVLEGMKRFIYGLSKKVLLADRIGQLADICFSRNTQTSVCLAWLGAVSYTLQIYFDFSGYSDMAIGLGRIFGFHFPENFNYPYISKSITEFWHRWHISLSQWFRDYVYIPMGGNRVRKSLWIRNLFIVWLLTGIWHGANWTFVLWGLLYFVILLLEKVTGCPWKKGILSRIYTMGIVIIQWVIFRSENVSSAIKYIGCMFGIGAHGIIGQDFLGFIRLSGGLILLAAIIASTPVLKIMRQKVDAKIWGIIEPLWILLIFGASLVTVLASTYSPFIYFNF